MCIYVQCAFNAFLYCVSVFVYLSVCFCLTACVFIICIFVCASLYLYMCVLTCFIVYAFSYESLFVSVYLHDPCIMCACVFVYMYACVFAYVCMCSFVVIIAEKVSVKPYALYACEHARV